MHVIYHSEFMVGLSSGLSWLTHSLGKHVVMIANFSEPNHEFWYNCTRVTNTNVCNSCWNNKNFKFDKSWEWCPIHRGTNRVYECQKSITAQMVIDKLPLKSASLDTSTM
jgi:autotransporter strand-loop-strand O-heptosyltransferase